MVSTDSRPSLDLDAMIARYDTALGEWARTFVGPWVMRRIRGVSSGDGLTPRWPKPVSAAELA